MEKSESIAALAKALCATQLELENASKSADNPFFKSKYADLAEILRCIKPVAAKHGLSYTQMPSYDAASSTVHLETMLMHESGEYITSISGAPMGNKKDAQAMGSVTTYLRRYSLSAVFGLAQEDDDGNTAVGVTPAKPSPEDQSWIDAIKAGQCQLSQITDAAQNKRVQEYMK